MSLHQRDCSIGLRQPLRGEGGHLHIVVDTRPDHIALGLAPIKWAGVALTSAKQNGGGMYSQRRRKGEKRDEREWHLLVAMTLVFRAVFFVALPGIFSFP